MWMRIIDTARNERCVRKTNVREVIALRPQRLMGALQGTV